MSVVVGGWGIDVPDLQRAGFRDLGGYPTRDGRQTCTGLLYRSAGLTDLSDGAREVLRSLRLRASIDLRSSFEVAAAPGWEAEEAVVRLHHPVVEAASAADYLHAMSADVAGARDPASDDHPDLTRLYRTLVTEGATAFARAFTDVVGNMPSIHYCSGGRDRSGILSALLLSVAGCDAPVITTEYRWSAPEGDTTAIEEVLEFWNSKWGGADHYLVAHGVSPTILQAFRRQFVSSDGRPSSHVVVNLQQGTRSVEPRV